MPSDIQLDSSELDCNVARLLDDLAHHGRAAEDISALGERAIAPLAHYLEGPPQSFPQARQFAAHLLGLIGGAAAVDALRAVLTRHDLAALDPVLAQSEYAVKDEAVMQLLHSPCGDLGEEFLGAFRRDRLPAAAAALARLRVVDAIPDLVAALEDDLLAARAADALHQFGASAEALLVQTLADRRGESGAGGESRVSRSRRVRAAMLLGEIGGPAAVEPLQLMAGDRNPTVRAAAAVALYALLPERLSAEQVHSIVAGSVSQEWQVRERCQHAAAAIGAACVPAAIEALTAGTTLDLYGVPRPVGEPEKRWLVTLTLTNAPSDAGGLNPALVACDPLLLAGGLAAVREPRAAQSAASLRRHRDPVVRVAVAEALGRLGGVPAADALLELATDPTRRVRVSAARALRALAKSGTGPAPAARSGLRRRIPWAARARLWWALRRTGRKPGDQSG